MPGKLPLIVIALLAIVLAGSVNSNRAREANRAYLDRDYERAEQLYRQILDREPESPRILFNLGNALAYQGRFEESVEVFQKFRKLVDDPSAKSAAEYNMGYLYGIEGNLRESLRYFQDAITFDPSDEDALFNYELIRRRLQDGPPDQGDDDQQEDQQQDPQDSPIPPTQDQDPDQQDQETQPSPTEAEDQTPLSDQDRQQGRRPEITDQQLEHAEDIMNALEQIEKDLIKDFKKRQHDAVEPHEKDW
jgi:Ca-activated chloride channel homolog